MSLRKAYIEYLKTKIEPLIDLNTPEKMDTDYHDEFSYNTNADVDVTVKFLPGQIQTGVVQYPGELLIAIKEKHFNALSKVFATFTTTYNENVISFTELNEKYREYYTTPNVIGVFQNGGIENYVSISISFSLITFTDVLGLDSLTLRYNSGFSNKETIKWLNFNVVYAGDGTSNSGLNGDNYSKETINKGGITYTFTFVPKVMSGENQITTRNLMLQALTGKYIGLSEQPFNTNAKYELGLTMGDLFGSNNAEYVCNCVVKSCTYNQEANGLPTLQVTLTRGDT